MAKKIFVVSFITMFVCFLVLYIVGLTGYFDYKQHEKMVLTKENEEEYDYNNAVSRLGMDLSNNIEKYAKIVLGSVFKAFNEVIK